MRSEDYCTCCVCVCVCESVSTYFCTMRSKGLATKKRYRQVQCHTGLIYNQAIFVNPLHSKVMVYNTNKKANMIICTSSPRPAFAALHTVEALKLLNRQIVSQKLHSNTMYEYSYPVKARNDRLSAWIYGLYTCIYIAVACVYNLVHILCICAEGLRFNCNLYSV